MDRSFTAQSYIFLWFKGVLISSRLLNINKCGQNFDVICLNMRFELSRICAFDETSKPQVILLSRLNCSPSYVTLIQRRGIRLFDDVITTAILWKINKTEPSNVIIYLLDNTTDFVEILEERHY